MYLVKATAKWRQNLLPIPVAGENAVKYPINPPHMISVPPNTADYLVSKGLAYVCNAYGEEISSDFGGAKKADLPLPEEEVKPEAATAPNKSEADNKEDQNTQDTESWLSSISDADRESYQNAAIAFISKKGKREISRVKWVTADIVTSLKEIKDLDWESLSNSLDSRQIESLLKHVAKKSS